MHAAPGGLAPPEGLRVRVEARVQELVGRLGEEGGEVPGVVVVGAEGGGPCGPCGVFVGVEVRMFLGEEDGEGGEEKGVEGVGGRRWGGGGGRGLEVEEGLEGGGCGD